MNKEDVKKIQNRIEFLTREFDANTQKIRLLQIENHRLQGAVKELNLALENLTHKKKEVEKATPKKK